MFCTHCGVQTNPDDHYCANCGSALVDTIQQENKLTSSAPNDAITSDRGNIRREGPSGVGGWLAYLIVAMMVIGPLFTFVSTNSALTTAEYQNPKIVASDIWQTYKTAVWGVVIIGAGLSFCGGLRLARGRNWNAVKQAISILWLTGPGEVIALIMLPFFIVGQIEEINPRIIMNLTSSVIATGIWSAYLANSQRVRATYPRF